MKKKKSHKVRNTVLVLLVLAAAAALFFWPKQKRERASMLTSITTEEAHRGTIRLVTEGNGSIEAADETLEPAEYTMKITKVLAENGDQVKKGDVIARLDSDSLQDQIEALETQLSELNRTISVMDRSGSSVLSSPVSGRVKRIFVEEGELLEDAVAEHGGVMEIAADGKLKAEIPSSDSLKAGQDVTVSFGDYEEEGYLAEENGTYAAVIEDGENYSVDTRADVFDEEGRLIGNGSLKSNHPYLVEGAYGIAQEIYVGENEYVSNGSSLLERRNYTYNAEYLSLLTKREELTEKLQEVRLLHRDPVLRAAGDGIISELALDDGMTAAEQTPMYRLISTEKFWLKTEIDELDIARVKVGQSAAIVFDAFDSEEYEGRVEKISALGQNVSGVTRYTVTISVPGIEKVKTAMSATATIVTDEKEDALLVPLDAIQTVDGQKCVTVVRGEEQETVPVTLGLVNNTEAEVLEGISEGDQVTVIGKSEFQMMVDMMQRGHSQNRGGGN